MKEDYQKGLKKGNLIFSFELVPFNRQNYRKQKRPGTSDQWLFRLPNELRKTPFLVMYYITKFDYVMQSSF